MNDQPDQPVDNLPNQLDFTLAGPVTGTALEHTIAQCTAHCDVFGDLLRNAPAGTGEPWTTYWQGRAGGTPVSRREHALEHYLGHLRTSHDYTRLSGAVDADGLRAATGVLENPEWLRLGNRQLSIETPLTAGHALPGALVFALEGEAQQVLYRPGRQPAFSAYATRQALDAELLATGEAGQSVSYLSVDSATAGFDSLLASLLRAPVGTGRGSQVVLAAPPPLDAATDATATASLHDFGSLAADVSPTVARQQIQRQLDLMVPSAEQLPALIEHRDAVRTARMDASRAIGRLLRGGWQHAPIDTGALADLTGAQRAGLLAHARFQRLLGQISTQELDWIESLTAQGDAFPGPEALTIAAHPLLYRPVVEGEPANSDRQLIEDALIITHRDALDRLNTQYALLLYWPGEHGGLLRCADRSMLEQCLGAPPGSDLAVGLSPVHGDVLRGVLAYHLEHARGAAAADQDESDVAAWHEDALHLSLQVPAHAAREAALDSLMHEQDSASLAGVLPDWLANTARDTRLALRGLLEHYATAMRKAQALLSRDLPHRGLFCWQRINRRLAQDFDGYDGTPIGLELPRSTSRRKDPIAGSGAPGVPFREVLVPSAEREMHSLEDLLLENLDEAMLDRLRFLTVHCPIDNARVRQAVASGLDKAYLQTLATELDLAQAYEDCILASYRGIDDTPYAEQYRRECLVEPWRLMLRVQGVLGQARGKLHEEGQAILEIAIDANSAEQYRTAGHDIRLIGALLSSGGTDTADRPAPLSGVTFVTDQRSGITLLCQPEHPAQPLAQYPSLEAARLALYGQARQREGLDYLAGRALLGNPDAHRSRLRQALDHGFDGVIALGSPWPAHLSLAHHLLDAQMGRVIAAHRATSRSNRDLWLENFAYQSGMVFNYLKMVMGFVPVVGSVIGVYDFFDAAYGAAKALVQGQGERALEELEQALLALIDAAMDLAPGVAVGVNVRSARRLARQRQLKGTAPSGSASRQRLERFAGYEHAAPLSLSAVQPGTRGRFSGIYQHAEGDFILVGDRPCKVNWDATAHTWRLAGTPRKGFKRAVALDAQGRWDTHFALYGTHLHGGGAGGGQALGRLAEQLEPYWPAALRQRLPRFWTDRVYRRQHLLYSKALAEESQLQASLARSNELYTRFDLAEDSDKLSMLAELEQRCVADVEQGKQLYDTWHGYLQLSSGRNRQVPLRQKARTATVVGDRLVHLLELKARRSRRRLAEIGVLHIRINESAGLAQQLPWWRQLRRKAIEHLAEREQIFDTVDQLDTWHGRGESTSVLRKVHDRYRQTLNAGFRDFFNTQHLMHAAQRFDDASPGAVFLIQRLHKSEEAALRASSTLIDLQHVQASSAQRRQIQEQVRHAYLDYRRRLQSTQASAPQLFDELYLEQLYDNLDAVIARAERTIRRTPSDARPARGPSAPRLFQTVEGQLYIGDYLPATATKPGYMVMRGETGGEVGRFVSSGEHWQPLPAHRAARPHELAELKAAAVRLVADLDSYQARIAMYQRQGMLPADLEHMMVIKAEDLESCARRLNELDRATAEPALLLAHARRLRERGKALRAAQIKRSPQPNEGQLTYLLEEQHVELQRLQGRRRLKAGDHLQEYAVLDLSDPARTPLWYAHFHYRDPQTPFEQYSAAHLKLAADRYRGPEWQQGQAVPVPVWRGAISRPVASRHFAGL
ncbi:hypothetical protein PS627_02108 [Pseudomonas fluorescens]|uniref:dermonecrotic toxin domain-containing protein n=1 Tax=Pseudomonas fluorescens TaxID=294 RepID=UPI00125287D7|nr:DUF6543 domain-containing protein [Pseudomonas fluorescens]CAG8866795.1 hypothetical protein PS627_02108 [Pseudomonas fluorescens]VVP90664.1 hypothetical protein PS910_02847 [Pseudomonas fluorescens]